MTRFTHAHPNDIPMTRRDLLAAAGRGAVLAGMAGAGLAAGTSLSPSPALAAAAAAAGGERKVGFAVVGLGQLGLGQIMPAFKDCKLAHPVALVSGHPDKARKTAEQYGVDPKNIYN